MAYIIEARRLQAKREQVLYIAPDHLEDMYVRSPIDAKRWQTRYGAQRWLAARGLDGRMKVLDEAEA